MAIGRGRRTSKEMWSLPILTSSSCLPTMFFLGQLASSSLGEMRGCGERRGDALCDFARVDDVLQFLDDERADPHCGKIGWRREKKGSGALSLRMRLSFL